MRLDEEQQRQVADILKKGDIRPTPDDFDLFIERLEKSIEVFRKASAKRRAGKQAVTSLADYNVESELPPMATSRCAHNELRKLFLEADKLFRKRNNRGEYNTNATTIIRKLLQRLPEQGMQYLDRRAIDVIPKLFRDEKADDGFKQWAKNAPDRRFVEAVWVLSSEGGTPVNRSRGPGKRSGERAEPVIMGVARGVERKPAEAADGDKLIAFITNPETGLVFPSEIPVARGPHQHKLKEGRPGNEPLQNLIRHLAIDWVLLTEESPIAGRSDHTAFGNLVHSILQWVGIEYEGAVNALRQFSVSRNDRGRERS
jgi:hypothetical protein